MMSYAQGQRLSYLTLRSILYSIAIVLVVSFCESVTLCLQVTTKNCLSGYKLVNRCSNNAYSYMHNMKIVYGILACVF